MIKTIEIKLRDEEGNYSIAYVDYKGYVDMIVDHNIDMVHDVIQSMVDDFSENEPMVKVTKDPIAAHEGKGAPHKH